MAKKREKPPVNPLSSDLIAAAVAPVEERSDFKGVTERNPESRKEPPGRTTAETPGVVTKSRPRPRAQETLRVRFPDSEFEAMKNLTKSLRKLMGGSKVTESDITRALWSLAIRAEETMTDLKGKAPKQQRPPNGDWWAKAEYDDAVAHFLHLAFKKMSTGN